MIRLLIILVLVNLAELHWPCSRHDRPKTWRHRPHNDYHRRHRPHNDYLRTHENSVLDDLARDIINIDRKLQQLCVTNGNVKTKEIFGVEHYKLTVLLEDYKEEDISVRTKYRLLHVNAQKSDGNYEEIRIIPDFVDMSSAHWKLENGELSLIFPYITPLNNETQRTCEIITNDDIITMTKSNATQEEGEGIDIRFLTDDVDHPSTENTPTSAHSSQGDAKPIKDESNHLYDIK